LKSTCIRVDAFLAKSEIYEIEEYDAVFYEPPNSQSALEKLRKRELEASSSLRATPSTVSRKHKVYRVWFHQLPSSSKTTSLNNDGLRIRITSLRSSPPCSLFTPHKSIHTQKHFDCKLSLRKSYREPSDLGGKEYVVIEGSLRYMYVELLLNFCDKEKATKIEILSF